jgi:UDP-N-acetyl-D-mannosaminuronate dehydrogenase
MRGDERNSGEGVAHGDILDNAVVCVVGLGVVGWPLAREFARHGRVIGFDTDEAKLLRLQAANDADNLELTSDPEGIGQADFILIAVPIPLTETKIHHLMAKPPDFGSRIPP